MVYKNNLIIFFKKHFAELSNIYYYQPLILIDHNINAILKNKFNYNVDKIISVKIAYRNNHILSPSYNTNNKYFNSFFRVNNTKST